MSLTREDILRELELLPAWKLRNTVLNDTIFKKQSIAVSELTIIEPMVFNARSNPALIEPLMPELAMTEIDQTASPILYMASEEGEFLFLLPHHASKDQLSTESNIHKVKLPTDEAILLGNICKAMQIKTNSIKVGLNIVEILKQNQAKLLIAMGESTAHFVLQSTEPLESLRGVVHALHDSSLVVTYDLKHLIHNVPDKAKAWNDLCLAMHTLQHLKSAI